jgi:hypothetical protein
VSWPSTPFLKAPKQSPSTPAPSRLDCSSWSFYQPNGPFQGHQNIQEMKTINYFGIFLFESWTPPNLYDGTLYLYLELFTSLLILHCTLFCFISSWADSDRCPYSFDSENDGY